MTGVIELDAFLFGIISAVSLPLGALLALRWTPKPRVLASLMAIGAGALLAALTIDLVAVSVDKGHFYPLALGMILGGLFFALLNSIVNRRGGFLRKSATMITHVLKKQSKRDRMLYERMSKVKLFHNLAPSKAHLIIPLLHRYHFREGKLMVHEGDPGDLMFIVEDGEALVIDDNTNDVVTILRENETYGILELLQGATHKYNVVVKNDMNVWVLNKEALDKLLSLHPDLLKDIQNLIEKELLLYNPQEIVEPGKAQEWFEEAMGLPHAGKAGFTETEMHEEVKEHGNASLAIWLGILLDGIPESIVIGSNLLIHGTMSMSLLAGLFLSNFPEALSSSVGMRKQRMSSKRILMMWVSIMLITGFGALIGNVYFENVSPVYFSLVNGMAAGAMLTMIAQTMLPEAFHIGGSVTGLSALGGFLATLLFKMIGG